MSKQSFPWPDVRRRVSGETTPPRMWLLTLLAVVLGLVGGVAAVSLFKLIGLISHLALLHNVGFGLPTLRGYHPSLLIIATTVGGALVVSALALWAPVIRGHGIPESLEAILVRESRIPLRAAIAKPLSAAICIGTGGPFGAEGPIIVTGGSIGSLIGQLVPVSPIERKILLATGAAAGMSATFNAPVASVLLAVELLLFERSLRTIVPVATAAAFAAAVRVLVFGPTPLFAIHAHLSVGLAQLPLFVVLGLLSGALAVILSKGLFAIEAGFRKLPVSILWWPMIGALGYALIGLLVPRTLSLGYSAISDTLNGHFALGALAVLFIAKLMSWWLALGSQTSGGTLAPMFLVGACMGAIAGDGLIHVWPALHLDPATFALVAMGATFAAAAKAPLTAVVFCAEVTGQYSMVVPLIVGVVAAELVAQLFLGDRIMTEKLSHRGFRVDFDMEVDVLRQWVVRQAMGEPLALPPDATVAQARQLAAHTGATTMAVADERGRYLGLVRATALGLGTGLPMPRLQDDEEDEARTGAEQNGRSALVLEPDDWRGSVEKTDAGGSLVEADADGLVVEAEQRIADELLDPDADIGSLISQGPAALAPNEHLVTALVHMIKEGLGGLPVVEDGVVIGHLRRVDIDAHRLRRHVHHEAIQSSRMPLGRPGGQRRGKRSPQELVAADRPSGPSTS